jgi:hypothetical protein
MAYCVDGQVYDLNTSLENLTGTLLDTNQYKYSTCSKRLPRNCSLGNVIIADGDSITTYNTYDTPDGTLCQSQVRACDDGTLS